MKHFLCRTTLGAGLVMAICMTSSVFTQPAAASGSGCFGGDAGCATWWTGGGTCYTNGSGNCACQNEEGRNLQTYECQE